MDYTQSFEEFSKSVGPTDLALYAGAGLILWVLFKDKLSPVQNLLVALTDKLKSLFNKDKPKVTTTVSTNSAVAVIENSLVAPLKTSVVVSNKEDLFFKLIASWKQTRDLAVSYGCSEAVKVADQMFPYLSPNVCSKEDVE